MMQLPLILAINPPSKVQLAQTGNSTLSPDVSRQLVGLISTWTLFE
jgi:hypothetical protein